MSTTVQKLNRKMPKNIKGVTKMPRGDETGPVGAGAMTGRGAGFCAGFSVSGTRNDPGVYGGFGYRRGAGGMMRGAGFQARNRFMVQPYGNVNVPVANEKEFLTNQISFLEKQLNQVKQRLENISPDPE